MTQIDFSEEEEEQQQEEKSSQILWVKKSLARSAAAVCVCVCVVVMTRVRWMVDCVDIPVNGQRGVVLLSCTFFEPLFAFFSKTSGGGNQLPAPHPPSPLSPPRPHLCNAAPV